MTINNILVLGAKEVTDHMKIRSACKVCSVPFTKVNEDLYIIDLCTANKENIESLKKSLGEIQPISLKMLREDK